MRSLILDGMRERWGAGFDPAVNPDVDDMWASYIATGGEIVVWVEDGAVVGTGTLVPEADGGGRIMRMSVARSWRRRGIGRRIVAELVRRAGRRGLRPVRVSTDTPWPEAVGLYAACGFAIVEQDDADTHFERLPVDAP